LRSVLGGQAGELKAATLTPQAEWLDDQRLRPAVVGHQLGLADGEGVTAEDCVLPLSFDS
jgi:hypothetical protein